MLTSEIKKKCADVISAFVVDFQARRAKVTDDVIDAFMRPRPLDFRGRATDTLIPALGDGAAKKGNQAADPNSKAQAKKAEKMRLAEEKKKQKAREKEEKDKAKGQATVVVPPAAPKEGAK
jgi:tryptophanyl-tRNA synthetase